MLIQFLCKAYIYMCIHSSDDATNEAYACVDRTLSEKRCAQARIDYRAQLDNVRQLKLQRCASLHDRHSESYVMHVRTQHVTSHQNTCKSVVFAVEHKLSISQIYSLSNTVILTLKRPKTCNTQFTSPADASQAAICNDVLTRCGGELFGAERNPLVMLHQLLSPSGDERSSVTTVNLNESCR